jgi:hypothetical protein
MKNQILLAVAVLSLNAVTAHARGGYEEQFIVSNGNGVSSPSYWNGLQGQNPAGLTANSSMKLQLGAGSLSGTNNVYGSGGLLIGNGAVAAGAEYLSKSAVGSNNGKLNWGLGGRIQSLNTSIGISSHAVANGGAPTYDIGLIIDPSSKFRFGFMVPNFTSTIDTFAAGIAVGVDNSVDVVVDADYSKSVSGGLVKPGLTFRSQSLQATVAYGVSYASGSTIATSSVLNDQLTIGFGAKLGNSMLFSYEYRGVVEHRAGLTIRLN